MLDLIKEIDCGKIIQWK